MKKKRMVFVLIFVMLVSVCTSMLNAIHIIDEISNENAKQRTHIISARVRDNILSEMLKPITVAKTMSNDESLIQ